MSSTSNISVALGGISGGAPVIWAGLFASFRQRTSNQGRDTGAQPQRTRLPVSVLGFDGEHRLLALPHCGDSAIPALDHFTWPKQVVTTLGHLPRHVAHLCPE